MQTLDKLDDLKVADQKGRITLGSKYAGKRFAVREEEDGSAVLIPVVVIHEAQHPLTAHSLDEAFAPLEAMSDDWDGYGSPAPSIALISLAKETLALLQAGALARGLRWLVPHISANERGQITLEWWRNERSLTVFIRDFEHVDYLKSWGINIESEMEDGELRHIADFASLSRWLYEETPELRQHAGLRHKMALDFSSQDMVTDDEILYRAVRGNSREIVLDAQGNPRIGSNAFNDAKRRPSVDRAKLCLGGLTEVRNRFTLGSGILSLSAHEL